MATQDAFDYCIEVSKKDDPCKEGYMRAHVSGARFGEAQEVFYRDGAEDRDGAMFTGATKEEWLKVVSEGDHASVREAEELARRVSAKLPLGDALPQLMPSVAGGGVSVPAALSGAPLCFQRPVWETDTTTPLVIAVDIGCSAGVSTSTMRKRGRAMLAVAMAIQTLRPVRLWAFSAMRWRGTNDGEVVATVDLGVSPLDWSRAGAVLGHPAALRMWSFNACSAACGVPYNSSDIGWASGYSGWSSDGDPRTGNEKLRERLALGDNDLLFDRGYVSDQRLKNDPEKWVLRILKQYADIDIQAAN